jgi:hypothetical protein
MTSVQAMGPKCVPASLSMPALHLTLPPEPLAFAFVHTESTHAVELNYDADTG